MTNHDRAVQMTQETCNGLADLSYEGIKLGPVIESLLYPVFLQDDISSTAPKFKDRIVWHPFLKACYYGLKTRHYSSTTVVPQAEILFDAIRHHRNVEMIYPLASKYSKQAVVISNEPMSPLSRFPFALIPDYAIPINLRLWARRVFQEFPKWHGAANQICKRLNLHPAHAGRIKSFLVFASLAIERMRALWSWVKPRLVVTICDHHPDGAILCALGREYGVPSITLQHGLLDRATLFLTVPIRADYYFAWGEYDAILMREHGTPNKAIRLTGCPRIKPRIQASVSEIAQIKAKLGCPNENKIAFLAVSNGLQDSELAAMIKVFDDAFEKKHGWKGFIRPHPAQTREEIERLLPPGSPIRVLANETLSIRETAVVANAVITHQTGLAMDTLLDGATIIGLDVLDASLGYVEELATVHRAAYKARCTVELIECFTSIESKDERFLKIQTEIEKVPAHFFAFLGEDSHQAVLTEINTILRNHDPLELPQNAA